MTAPPNLRSLLVPALFAAGLFPAGVQAQAPFVLELEPEMSAVIRDAAVGT